MQITSLIGSAVKSIDCSARGPGFYSNIHIAIQNVVPVPEQLTSLSIHCVDNMCTYTYIQVLIF